jgi:hypothetical protein
MVVVVEQPGIDAGISQCGLNGIEVHGIRYPGYKFKL